MIETAILFALIILNGVFAMSEIALVTARRVRLQRLAESGDTSAGAAIRLGEDPTQFLSTVQIGITSIGVLNGIVGEAALAQPFSVWLNGVGVQNPYAQYLATGLVVVSITYLTIVLGELVPKRLGQMAPETVARLVARPMLVLAATTRPFVRLLSGSTQLVLRTFGVNERAEPTVTQEEINLMLAEGSSAGVI